MLTTFLELPSKPFSSGIVRFGGCLLCGFLSFVDFGHVPPPQSSLYYENSESTVLVTRVLQIITEV